jgi:hypothetical protein
VLNSVLLFLQLSVNAAQEVVRAVSKGAIRRLGNWTLDSYEVLHIDPMIREAADEPQTKKTGNRLLQIIILIAIIITLFELFNIPVVRLFLGNIKF